jgi:hypothetical protein
MKQNLSEAMPPQVTSQRTLAFHESWRTPGRRERRREVEMQTRVDSSLTR